MLQVKTEEQKKKVLEIFGIQETCCHFSLDFDKEADWGYEEFDDRIYLDGNITFDQMATIVDYLREQNNKQRMDMKTCVNNKCRAFTSLEQSRKLAEFLPLESADCYWDYDEMQKFHRISLFEDGYNKVSQLRLNGNNVCAWSLAALMAVIPYNVSFNKAVYRFKMVKYSDHWECYHENFGSVSTEIFKADNSVDACVELIEKLHEQKLL